MDSKLTIPRATYRLQFHRGFTLRDALDLVPYLSALGVSHVYASPLLKAQPGSRHGYDVTDPTQINPEIGSESDLELFVSVLHEKRMGLVLDIVPNHMAAVRENPWWWDLLTNGRSSRFADFFDIDWHSPDPRLHGKVLLPVLGDELDRVLDRDELKVVCDNGEVTLRYFDHCFPVSPESILIPGKSLEQALTEINSDWRALAQILRQQHYRLDFWRHGDTDLNYRRFFTITHLAGVRVERPQVFTDTHCRIVDWHRKSLINGLRVDHPDGLRDPRDYLSQLRKVAPDTWIVVEKILEPGEDLPPDWPVNGTTGYEFLARVSALFIDPAGEKPLTEFYATFTGEPTDYGALVREKKRWILLHQLATEVDRLVRLLKAILAERSPKNDASPEDMREALVEIITCFPVYRTYSQAGIGPLSATDAVWISQALAEAMKSLRPSAAAALPFLIDLLRLNIPGDLENEFVMRFQQLTGPAMAKGVEDTTFYCFNRFVALNEVGGDPAHFGLSVDDFHQTCGQSLAHWPNTMLASTTHDTKRSEDVRSRLALLSEIPEQWATAVRRWSALNEKHRHDDWPDRNAEYLLYQTLVGAWPLPVDRALAYLEKASREAKQHTNWTHRNAAYDEALKDFVTAILADTEFTADLKEFLASLTRPGRLNSLAQTLLKLTVPGVPDIYQGTDLWDLSLVDPDNRRPVDYAQRRSAMVDLQKRLESGHVWELAEELLQSDADGRIKMFVIYQTLQLRRRQAQLFREGSYVPLLAKGKQAKHVCAFARSFKGTTAITITPRLILGLVGGRSSLPLGEDIWEDTRLVWPSAQAHDGYRNVLTGEVFGLHKDGPEASLRLAEALKRFPVALLETVDPSARSVSETIPKR